MGSLSSHPSLESSHSTSTSVGLKEVASVVLEVPGGLDVAIGLHAESEVHGCHGMGFCSHMPTSALQQWMGVPGKHQVPCLGPAAPKTERRRGLSTVVSNSEQSFWIASEL